MQIVVASILVAGWIASLMLAWIYRKEIRTGGWRLHFLNFELTVGRFIAFVSLGTLVLSILGTLVLLNGWRVGALAPNTLAGGAALLVLAWVGLIARKYYGGLPDELGLRKPRFGPYLQITSDGAIQVSWDTPSATPTRLLWGRSPDSLSARPLDTDARFMRHHRVVLRGLQAGLPYFYRVPSARNRLHRFRAPPARDSGGMASFVVVGDPQSAFHVQRAIVRHIARARPPADFVVLAGDLVEADNDHVGWRTLFDRRSFGGLASEIPLMAAAGNHDGYTLKHLPLGRGRSRFMQRFQNVYPYGEGSLDEASKRGHYFSFDYANIHMVVLDNYEGAKSPLLGEAQLAWLQTDLAKASGVWRFVTIHVPVYTLTRGVEWGDYVEQLEPIFEAYDVHAVFAGHEHVYQAFFRPRAGGQSGTYHFLLGGGGGALEDYTHPRWKEARWPDKRIDRESLTPHARQNPCSAWFLEGENCHHYLQVVVGDERAEFRAIRSPDGRQIGSYEARLRGAATAMRTTN